MDFKGSFLPEVGGYRYKIWAPLIKKRRLRKHTCFRRHVMYLKAKTRKSLGTFLTF